MKKALFTLVLILFTCAAANSQFFVGGSFGFSSSGGNESTGNNSFDKTTETSFMFSPKVGYILNENFYVGAQIMLGTEKEKEANGDYEKMSGFAFAPFARYYAFRMNKLSVFGQADLTFTSGSSKEKNGTVTTDGEKISGIGFSVTPGIAFDLTEKIELEAAINVFSLSMSSVTKKQEFSGVEYKDKTTSFDFGANMDHVLTTGSVTIGMIYKF